MKNKKNLGLVTAVALSLSLSFSLSVSAQAADSAAAAVAKCEGSKDQQGQMPYGATDEDIKSYKSGELCAQNQGRDVGKNCQKSVDKLIEVAEKIHGMVIAGCQKFMPLFQQKGMDSCFHTQGQSGCVGDQVNQLKQMNAKIKEFRVELKNFASAMKEVQSNLQETSTQVVDVLKDNESKRNTSSYNQSDISSSSMGVGSVKQSDELNNFQNSQAAKSIVDELQQKFSKSDYSDATTANYGQKLQSIHQSFDKVGNLDSQVLREQLHTYIKAEELKLGSQLNDNQMASLEKQTSVMSATDSNSVTNFSSLTGTGATAATAAGGLSGVASSGLSGGSGASGSDASSNPYNQYASYASPGSSAATKGGSLGGINSAATNLGGANSVAIDGTQAANSATGDGSAASGASRSPASLREALRKKLANEKLNGATGGSTSASTSAQAAAGDKSKDGGGTGLAGVRGINGDTALSATGGAGGSSDPALEDFKPFDLAEGGFAIAGAGTDASVKNMLSEFQDAMGVSHQASDDIGATDGPSLFARVKEFHGRCLRRGCVLGNAKGNI